MEFALADDHATASAAWSRWFIERLTTCPERGYAGVDPRLRRVERRLEFAVGVSAKQRHDTREKQSRALLSILLVKWQLQLLALTFGFHFGAADTRLQLQQFQLRLGELLAAGRVLLDQYQTQSFFQYLDFIFCEP